MNLPGTIYVTRYDEELPVAAGDYDMTRFDNFLVFTPHP